MRGPTKPIESRGTVAKLSWKSGPNPSPQLYPQLHKQLMRAHARGLGRERTVKRKRQDPAKIVQLNSGLEVLSKIKEQQDGVSSPLSNNASTKNKNRIYRKELALALLLLTAAARSLELAHQVDTLFITCIENPFHA
ncbi:hypothetical protein ACFE04_005066 [Oxalis oulophora]